MWSSWTPNPSVPFGTRWCVRNPRFLLLWPRWSSHFTKSHIVRARQRKQIRSVHAPKRFQCYHSCLLPVRGLRFILWWRVVEQCARFIRAKQHACPTCVLWTSQAFLFFLFDLIWFFFWECNRLSFITGVLRARFLWWEPHLQTAVC